MLSKRCRKSIANMGLILATGCFCGSPHLAGAAAKVKPEIPLGEETYEPTSATKKNKPEAAHPSSKEEPHAAPVNKDAQAAPAHSDDHAAPAAAQGDVPAASAPNVEHGVESHPVGTKSETHQTENLLEGKVPPATPAKGSGFIWFGVVFVLLAVAIFIFT